MTWRSCTHQQKQIGLLYWVRHSIKLDYVGKSRHHSRFDNENTCKRIFTLDSYKFWNPPYFWHLKWQTLWSTISKFIKMAKDVNGLRSAYCMAKDVCRPTSAHYMATCFSLVDIVPGYKTQTNRILAWINISSHQRLIPRSVYQDWFHIE